VAPSATTQDETEAPAAENEPAEEVAPLTLLDVTLFFPSSKTDGLQGEQREIFDTASPVERAKQILSDLIAGPSGPDSLPAVPKGTRLRQVFVLESGVAYADFSAELRDGMPGGTDNELLTVYAIVNSIVLNVPEIKSVAILVDGEPCPTLSGHLDLRRPLGADTSLNPSKSDGRIL
jgi:spore germination protein GerM